MSSPKIVLFGLIICSLFFADIACSSSKPSQSQVLTDSQGVLDKHWPGMCKITSFEQIDGENDSGTYTYHYRYRAKILQDTDGYPANGLKIHISHLKGFKWIETQVEPPNKRIYPLKDIRQGDIFEVEHFKIYKQSKEGWIQIEKTYGSK
jgi:hypothetical protein